MSACEKCWRDSKGHGVSSHEYAWSEAVLERRGPVEGRQVER